MQYILLLQNYDMYLAEYTLESLRTDLKGGNLREKANGKAYFSSRVGNNKHLNIQSTSLLSNGGKENRINKFNLKCESIFKEIKGNP